MKLGISGFLTQTFIRSPLTPLLLLASLALGTMALMLLPREEEPQISVPMVDVLVRADGLKAEDAVELVTKPLEDIVKGIDAVEHVYSQTEDDGVMVTARFYVGTDEDRAIQRVHEEILANIKQLPLGIPEPLIVGRGINDVPIVTLTLSPKHDVAGRWSDNALYDIAEELLHEIIKIEDVGLTFIVGGRPDQIRVEPDPERLSLYGVTLNQLVDKVRNANRSFVVGRMRQNDRSVPVVAGQTLQGVPDIGLLLITTRDGRPVYVKDIADIVVGAKPEEHQVWHMVKDADGNLAERPAVTLAIAKRKGANAVVVADKILERLELVRGEVIPVDVDVTTTRNYGETASEKADELLFHLGLATVSIVLLITFVLGWREGMVVLVVIPTTILLTLFASWLMGYTINRVSLFALIFSIGILVDDAIVVVENIARHWRMKDGRGAMRAAIEGVAEVGNPTIIATLTIVVALLPMMFVSGLMGPYMSPIPANASAAMIFSFFVAVIMTPWLLCKVFRIGSDRVKPFPDDGADFVGDQGHGEHHEGVMGRLYRRVAAPMLVGRFRSILFLVLTGAATAGVCLAFLTKDVTVKLLPFDNKSELAVVIDLPEGSSVEATDAVAQDVARAVLDLPEVVSIQTHAGAAAPFNFNGLVRHYYLREKPELGDVQINLLPKAERERTSHDIALEIRERITALQVPPGTSLKTVEPPPGPPVISTLLAEVYGPDAETRRAAARQIRAAFEAVPFVVDVDDNFGEQSRRLRATISTDQLEFFGVQESDVFSTIAILNGGTTVGYSHRGEGRHPIPIRVERDKAHRVVDESFLTTPIPANVLPGARGVVELGDVVTIREEHASFPIFRHNGRAAEMVMAELAGDFEAPLYGMLAVADKLEQMDWPEGTKPTISLHGQPEDESHVTLLWDGEWEVTWVTFRDMGAAFAVALLGIYILVVAQFGSFRLPLVILTPIPLTFLGIIGGHWLFAAPFSATSMIGFIALAGIIVRNSILLVDFIRHEGGPDIPLVDTLIAAGAIRFKPILLTAIAAMIGAVVILADPIFQGLAISLLFGLLSSTLLTVLVIPAIYRVFKT